VYNFPETIPTDLYRHIYPYDKMPENSSDWPGLEKEAVYPEHNGNPQDMKIKEQPM
jgi:hypothetical protein